MHLDTSAILWSAPEHEREGRPLIVLLHGYGSHEGDLFGLAPALPLGAVVASVRAPLAESGGFAWFSRIDSPSGAPSAERVDAAARAVLDWLDTLPAHSSITLLGFSQGAATALQLLRHAPARFAAVLAISGFLSPDPQPGDAELAQSRPPVFWGRGDADPLFAPEVIERLEAWLDAHATVEKHVYAGLGHSISQEELRDMVAFIALHSV